MSLLPFRRHSENKHKAPQLPYRALNYSLARLRAAHRQGCSEAQCSVAGHVRGGPVNTAGYKGSYPVFRFLHLWLENCVDIYVYVCVYGYVYIRVHTPCHITGILIDGGSLGALHMALMQRRDTDKYYCLLPDQIDPEALPQLYERGRSTRCAEPTLLLLGS